MPRRAKTSNKKVLNQASLAAGAIIDNIVTLTKGGRTQSSTKNVENHASVTDDNIVETMDKPKQSTAPNDSSNQADRKVGMFKLQIYI